MVDVVSLPNPEPPPKTAFTSELPTTAKILATLSYCQEHGELGVIVGAAGIGKTQAVSHHVSAEKHAFVATMAPSRSELVPAMGHIADALGAWRPNSGAAAIREAIVARLSETMKPQLLIIDEAQFLSDNAIEEVRSLFDATGIGIVLAGNPELVTRWADKRAGRRGMWAQLRSRIGPMLHIPAPLPEDVDTLCDHLGNVTAAARKLLKKRVLGPGGLRDVRHLVEMGGKLAKGGPIKPCHIEDAMQFRGAGR